MNSQIQLRKVLIYWLLQWCRGVAGYYSDVEVWIYTDGWSKYLKCCSSVAITASYHLVYYRPSTSYWVEPRVQGSIKLV